MYRTWEVACGSVFRIIIIMCVCNSAPCVSWLSDWACSVPFPLVTTLLRKIIPVNGIHWPKLRLSDTLWSGASSKMAHLFINWQSKADQPWEALRDAQKMLLFWNARRESNVDLYCIWMGFLSVDFWWPYLGFHVKTLDIFNVCVFIVYKWSSLKLTDVSGLGYFAGQFHFGEQTDDLRPSSMEQSKIILQMCKVSHVLSDVGF